MSDPICRNLDYTMFSLDDDDEFTVFPVASDHKDVTVEAFCHEEFTTRIAYLSSFGYQMRALTKKYTLRREQQVQLFGAFILLDAPCKAWYICNRWLSSEVASLGEDDNLLLLFYDDATEFCSSPIGGAESRFTPFSGDWAESILKTDEHGDQTAMHDYLEHIEEILCQADKPGASSFDILKMARKLPKLGDFTSQLFLQLAVVCGLVTKNLAHAHHAEVAEKKPHCEYMKELGCDTKEKRNALLVGMSAAFLMQPDEIENSLCKLCRTKQKNDVFFKGQSIYRLEYNLQVGQLVLLEKKYGQTTWDPV